MSETKCRIWWPKDLLTYKPINATTDTNLVLFGWYISSSPTYLDVVVSFAYEEKLLSQHSFLSKDQEVIHHTNEAMPISLQDKSRFTALGQCTVAFENSDHMCQSNMASSDNTLPCHCTEALSHNNQNTGLLNSRKSSGSRYCLSWIQLVKKACEFSRDDVSWVPTLHHLHWNGSILHEAELHVVVYETPRFGSHHFSVEACSSMCIKGHPRKPKWVENLYQKPKRIDLDTVVLALNCSAAAKMCFDRDLGLERSSCYLHILQMFLSFICRISAGVVASYFTFLYIVLQLIYKLATFGLIVGPSNFLADVFSSTWRYIQVRCYQIFYWPILLRENGMRCQACVEYAEKAAQRRHTLWSSMVVDIILGNLVGFSLLLHTEDVLKWISALASDFTDDVLRIGCVWLMGIPAGFKLNTELAGVLGMISLNAIQIWSTLWFSAAYIYHYVIRVIALSGILLGLTIPAALFEDLIGIAAFHVSTLHRLISLVYSVEIQALTALWRLFRGRKSNPLRHREDSYEYSVEQHIVGSLLFTPILLLLPTVSVFYIYFTMTNLTVIFLRMLIEIMISVIHATPYVKMQLMLVNRRRYPSGIWFDLMHSKIASYANDGFTGKTSSAWKNMQKQSTQTRRSGTLFSFLCSNYLTFGQVVYPHYKNVFSGVCRSTIASAVSGILTGKSSMQLSDGAWLRASSESALDVDSLERLLVHLL